MSESNIPYKSFYMPAEWENHKSTWLAWPYDTTTFPDRVEKIEKIFALIVYYLHFNEIIELLIIDNKMKKRAGKILLENSVDINRVNFHISDYADVWMRDYGPSFLSERSGSGTALVKWRYNAYGEKFSDLLKDNDVFYKFEKYFDFPFFKSDLVMEGGAFDVNGDGILITTEECLLNPNRNPNLSKTDIEVSLKKFLGVKKIIWLKNGVVGDHTDGHIDEVARFVTKNKIIIAWEDDKKDPNFDILSENYNILMNSLDCNSNPFDIIKLPIPRMKYNNGERAPVSYTNFYIANKFVLVPLFNHKNDELALNILQEIYPDRKAVGINCCDLIYGGGTIHCVTQQQPIEQKILNN